MEDFDLDIPEFINSDDFTIIYKGKKGENERNEEVVEEITTSKEEFLRKLRYFKNKASEITQTNEIFIHDIYPIKIFKEFIDTLKTKKIRINESNYSYYYQLSTKYEYYELKQRIESFLEKRPDINNLINNFKFDEIDYGKEENISKHLDICLKNKSMLNFPIPILVRILNSPQRKLNDHHLLFSFIQKVVKKYESVESDEDSETKNSNIQLLLGSLDYSQMSNDELDELFNYKNFSNIFNNSGSNQLMKTFSEERKQAAKKISELEIAIENQEKKHSAEIYSLVKMQKEMMEKINEINQKFEEQSHLLLKFKKDNELLQQKVQNQDAKMAGYEQKIKELEKVKQLTGSIKMTLKPDQKIEGEILIQEEGVKLDTAKSKFILNCTDSSTLGVNEYKNGFRIESLNQKFSFFKPAGTFYLHALLVDNLGNSKEIVSSPITTKGVDPLTFDFTGKVQSATLDPGSYKLEVWGAEGGKNGRYSEKSGKGGYSVGILKLASRTTLFVYVGESPRSGKGGWNGGGSGSGSESAGGGGATDISLYGVEGSTEWNTSNHLFSRIIVAGAGGGSGRNDYFRGLAGCGGGLNGQDSQYGNKDNGGSQTRAGVNSLYSIGEKFGVGGTHTGACSSGGGGGWYGGGASSNHATSTGGAGGSGYVYNASTASNYPSGCKLNSSFYLSDSSTKDGNTSFPSPLVNSNETGHSGNGYVKITLQ